ncbi:5'/3'-nucleotidase SurE [bacterium]|nr:5'/3'-nucleotidase SurE [bacterium]
MQILITNDDGIDAPGLRALAEEMAREDDIEVTVVAPHLQRSVSGHSLTFHSPLRIIRQWQEGKIRYYALDGTPSDCIMMGVFVLCPQKPDYVLTGINCGANMGYDVSYSATVSSALEGMVQGVPSIAVSICGRSPRNYQTAAVYAKKVLNRCLGKDLPEGELPLSVPKDTVLSINVPDLPFEEIKGAAFTHQGRSVYRQGVKSLKDPWGNDYYWIYGAVPEGSAEEGSDYKCVRDGYVSVTPIFMDATNYKALERLRSLNISF